MSRGQARDLIRLVRADGSIVESPFLNLGIELWDRAQRRMTLIIDPGRVKQGVGPNLREGAPLESSNRYSLIVDGSMKSAVGEAIGSDQKVVLRIGAAERRLVDPEIWDLVALAERRLDPLQVRFERSMDDAGSRRLIRVFGPDGGAVRGNIVTDGRDWSMTPKSPWPPGAYRLVIGPELEDVAGNTMRSAFDAQAETIGRAVEPREIIFRVKGLDKY